MTRVKIALVSMPWQDPFSPSIQLGALSAWVRARRPQVTVDEYHLYLELADAIGVHLAKRISISWIGEALFSYLLFPEKRSDIERYLERSRADDPAFTSLDYGKVIEALRVRLLRRLDEVDWAAYEMVGFSVVFAQTIPSLLAAREIGRRAPTTRIVFGGPGCTSLIGKSLLDTFPFLHYVVNGEGEQPLLRLVDALAEGTPEALEAIPALVHRGSSAEAFGKVDQVSDMRVLPVPDYNAYFQTARRSRQANDLLGRVRVPLETSRGCWWDRSHIDPMQSCSFCNLNLQWHGYREKSVEQAMHEIHTVVERHQVVDLTLVDNILRVKNVDAYLGAMEALDLGLDIWMEARASVAPADIRRLAGVGARVVQFGIEALSSSMLKKMAKGTTTIQNLQAMKFCEQYGIKNTANLIVDFPGMGSEEIEETLLNIEFARGYFPITPTEFSLVYQAPAYKAPERFDIGNIRNYHMYRLLLPDTLYDRLFLTEKSFDSDSVSRMKAGWDHVRAALANWETHYRRLRPVVEGSLLLSMQDGGTFLKIRDFRWEQARFYHIEEVERDVYLAASEITSIPKLCASFPSVTEQQLEGFVDSWVSRKLAFREGKRVLALAVPWGPVSLRRAGPERSIAPAMSVASEVSDVRT